MMFYGVVLLTTLGAVVIAQGCSPGPVDIMFVLSSDASLDSSVFFQKTDVLMAFVESVNIGSDHVRVGLITEQEDASLEFNMKEYVHQDELVLAVKFAYFKGGDSNFGSGLEFIRQRGMDGSLGGRPGIPDVVIFLTAGLPANISVAQREVELMSDAGITVIAVGVGNMDITDLENLASGCQYVSQSPDFSSVANIAAEAVNLTCEAIREGPGDSCVTTSVISTGLSPASPTTSPTALPTTSPTTSRTASTTASTTASPTASPTTSTTASPTTSPTTSPTESTTVSSTASTTASPTTSPTASTIASPTSSPSSTSPTSTTASSTSSPSSTSPTGSTSSPPSAQQCVFNPCHNGGTCVLLDDLTYNCVCPQGFTGAACFEQASTTPAPCQTNICHNGGTCVVSASGDDECLCPLGFEGLSCDDVSSTASCGPPERLSTVGCNPAEIVFLIEYSRGERPDQVEHEVEWIKEVIDEWQVDDQHIRVGVVVYHDTVREVIHITDFQNDFPALKRRINQLKRQLSPSGTPDLARALDYVRENSFTAARPGVSRVVWPVVHQISSQSAGDIPKAGERLRNECATIISVTVASTPETNNVMRQTVTQPYSGHYYHRENFAQLEYAAAAYNLAGRC